jgi:hypothetical protein
MIPVVSLSAFFLLAPVQGDRPPGLAPTVSGQAPATGTAPRQLTDEESAFVKDVSAPVRGRALARWDRAICVGVANMRTEHAQFMIDRVSSVALELGLEVGEPGCRPNIMIAATADADAFATGMVQDDLYSFRPALSDTDRGRRALEQFQITDAPVRWWHVSLPVSVDTGEPAMPLSGDDPVTVRVRNASRLRGNIRDDLARAVVILDMPRLGNVSFDALSDYVAVVALAQIDPAAAAAISPSILDLFSSANPPKGLTAWDREYLHVLYSDLRDRAAAPTP